MDFVDVYTGQANSGLRVKDNQTLRGKIHELIADTAVVVRIHIVTSLVSNWLLLYQFMIRFL